MNSVGVARSSELTSKNSSHASSHDTSADMEMSNSPVSSLTGSNLTNHAEHNWVYNNSTGVNPAVAVPNSAPDFSSEDHSNAAQFMMIMNAASYGPVAFLPGEASGPSNASAAGLIVSSTSGGLGVKEIIHLSGAIAYPPNPRYRVKVEGRADKEYSGKIHVDFAQARDDQYEFECAQRALMREHRHRNRSGTQSPSRSLVHYSDNEASQLLEKLKGAETLGDALGTLVGWLDKGECSKKSATQFYSMIAAVNAHVRRLIQEKQLFDCDLQKFKEKHKEKLQTLMIQFSRIEEVFRTARKQRNWDHFTKAQRKNLDQWLKQTENIRKTHENDMLSERQEENMETSDDEEDREPVSKKSKFDPVPFFQKQIEELTKELEQTKEKAKIEVAAAKAEADIRKQSEIPNIRTGAASELNQRLETERVTESRRKTDSSLVQTSHVHLSAKEAKFIGSAGM